MMVDRLFLTVPWGCLRFVIVVFPDHTHLLYFIIRKRHHKVPLILKQEFTGKQGSTIKAHMNPNYLSIQLGAKSNKNDVQQKGKRITFILTRPCMIFLGFSEVKMRFCRYMQGEESLLYLRFFQ